MNASVLLSEMGEPGKIYVDPESNFAEIESVQLKSRASKILLFKTVTATEKEIEKSSMQIQVFPVPTKDFIHFKLSDPVLARKDFMIELYNAEGIVVNRIPMKAGSANHTVSCVDLPAGLYFYRIPEIDAAGKFIKTDF